MILLARLFSWLCVLGLLTNCSAGVKFSEAPSQSDFSIETLVNADGSRTTTQKFKTENISVGDKVDIVWVIDNSGSMQEEINHVKQNLDAFIAHLSANSNVRLTVISESASVSPWGLDLSPYAVGLGVRQIYRRVTSTSALNDILTEQTTLSSYFRADASKMFVIVTDDNSALSFDSFMALLPESFKKGLSIFGFIALDYASSPCGARKGTVYMEAAQATNGATYNICVSDWSSHFSNLTNRIIAKVGGNSFKLSYTPTRIQSVKVNGVSTSEYTLVDDVLVINRSALNGIGAFSIQVTYDHL